MSTTDLIAAIASIRDTLSEARRYVRRHPHVAEGMLEAACEASSDLALERMSLPVGVRYYARVTDRAGENLRAASECPRAAPDAVIGCIDWVVWELGGLASGLRADLGRAARDAELAEAYGRTGDASLPA